MRIEIYCKCCDLVSAEFVITQMTESVLMNTNYDFLMKIKDSYYHNCADASRQLNYIIMRSLLNNYIDNENVKEACKELEKFYQLLCKYSHLHLRLFNS